VINASRNNYQIACFDMTIYDLNRACMTGEHWPAFVDLYDKRRRSCACGRVKRPLVVVGFIRPKERPVYLVPADITGKPCNYGVEFHPKALERLPKHC
jgi:hypothetical protein